MLIIPLLLDGFSQLYGLRDSNNFLRMITGVLAGLGLAMFVVSLYITITFNLLTSIMDAKKLKGGLSYEKIKY